MAKVSSKADNKPLSRARVIKEALKLTDTHGLGALSMRKLALALDVKAMSLYNHVSNKEDVLDGILDLVVSEFELPQIGKPWKNEMKKRALSAHKVLMRHPWASQLMLSRVNIGPAMLKWTNATVGCLVESGFSYPMADHAWNAIDNHIYGFTLQQVNAPIAPADYSDAAEHYLPLLVEAEYPYLNQMASLIAAGDHTGVNDFEFGLTLLLDGVENLLDEPPTNERGDNS